MRIDSIWGLPDGLQFYAHDSFELNAQLSGPIKQRLRNKDTYLVSAPNGSWVGVQSGVPWDWKPSLATQEIVEIAQKTYHLATQLGKRVVVMWFAGVAPETGCPLLLPWWHTFVETIPSAESAEPSDYSGRRRRDIVSREDLAKLSVETHDLSGSVLWLKPSADLVRSMRDTDDPFLTELASLATRHGLPVVLQGSPLQHVFYKLKQMRVRIRLADPLVPALRKQDFGKLVRDEIPLIIEQHGEGARVITVRGGDLVRLLKAKLVEEALELFRAASHDDALEELTDVYEVVRAIAEAIGATMDDVIRKADEKRHARGAFQKGYVLIQTRELPLIRVAQPKLGSEYKLLPEVSYHVEEVVETGPKVTEEFLRRPRLQKGEIRLPLVPPETREIVVSGDSLGVQFLIRYEDKHIVLRWFKQRPAISRDQLSFTALMFPGSGTPIP